MNNAKFMRDGESSFNFGGFILGFLFGIIGVALAYIFSDDKVFIKSTWKGFGILLIIILLAAFI